MELPWRGGVFTAHAFLRLLLLLLLCFILLFITPSDGQC
jgi:hypothetical protein